MDEAVVGEGVQVALVQSLVRMEMLKQLQLPLRLQLQQKVLLGIHMDWVLLVQVAFQLLLLLAEEHKLLEQGLHKATLVSSSVVCLSFCDSGTIPEIT